MEMPEHTKYKFYFAQNRYFSFAVKRAEAMIKISRIWSCEYLLKTVCLYYQIYKKINNIGVSVRMEGKGKCGLIRSKIIKEKIK
jgi:hypothetical protein